MDGSSRLPSSLVRNSTHLTLSERSAVKVSMPSEISMLVSRRALAFSATACAFSVVTEGSISRTLTSWVTEARVAPACLTAEATSSVDTPFPFCAGVKVKDSPSSATTTAASFISEVRVEFAVAASFLMDSSLTVTTGSTSRSEKRALTNAGRDVEPFIAASAVSSASTVMPASLSEASVVLPSTVSVTVAASARSLTAAITWSRVMPATGVPATVVPGRARPE